MKPQKKWIIATSAGLGLILFIYVVIPFARELYLSRRLKSVDISHLLIQSDDLPAGFVGGKITVRKSDYYQWIDAQEQEILADDGTKVGTVGVYLFASDNDQGKIYDLYSEMESQEGIIPYEVTGIGDCESCKPIFSISGCDLRVVFTRCTAVGYIEVNAACVNKDYDFDALVAHAKRLDENLKSVACQ